MTELLRQRLYFYTHPNGSDPPDEAPAKTLCFFMPGKRRTLQRIDILTRHGTNMVTSSGPETTRGNAGLQLEFATVRTIKELFNEFLHSPGLPHPHDVLMSIAQLKGIGRLEERDLEMYMKAMVQSETEHGITGYE